MVCCADNSSEVTSDTPLSVSCSSVSKNKMVKQLSHGPWYVVLTTGVQMTCDTPISSVMQLCAWRKLQETLQHRTVPCGTRHTQQSPHASQRCLYCQTITRACKSAVLQTPTWLDAMAYGVHMRSIHSCTALRERHDMPVTSCAWCSIKHGLTPAHRHKSSAAAAAAPNMTHVRWLTESKTTVASFCQPAYHARHIKSHQLAQPTVMCSLHAVLERSKQLVCWYIGSTSGPGTPCPMLQLPDQSRCWLAKHQPARVHALDRECQLQKNKCSHKKHMVRSHHVTVKFSPYLPAPSAKPQQLSITMCQIAGPCQHIQTRVHSHSGYFVTGQAVGLNWQMLLTCPQATGPDVPGNNSTISYNDSARHALQRLTQGPQHRTAAPGGVFF